jgi:peptide chain release factor 3
MGLAEDHDGALVYLARNAWYLQRTKDDWPQIRFLETREQNANPSLAAAS